MPLNLAGYPFDNTASAPSNRINPEVVNITSAGERIFVPAAGIVFGHNFKIYDQNGVLLQPVTDYILANLEKEATLATGRDCYSIVRVLKTSVTQVTLDYQTPGGIYADSAQSIRDLINSLPPGVPYAVYWGQILNRPVQFPPAAHLHHAGDIYGLGEVVTLLDEIRQAILVGDTAQFQAVYQYINDNVGSVVSDFLSQNVASIQEMYEGTDDVKFSSPRGVRYAVKTAFSSSEAEQLSVNIDTTDRTIIRKQLTFDPIDGPTDCIIHNYFHPEDNTGISFAGPTPRTQLAFGGNFKSIWTRSFNGTIWTPWVEVTRQSGVSHDEGNSYLLGKGIPTDPLTVDVDRLNNQFAQIKDLPISQVGDPNDVFLPASSGYFSITAPRNGRFSSGTMFLEANGDVLALTPTTNGELARMVYARVKRYAEGFNASVATDRVYMPLFLQPGESVQSVFPTSDNCMVVEIWHVQGGVEVFKEHAIVILNESLIDAYHTKAYRLGDMLLTAFAPGATTANVANGTPVAIINGDWVYLFLSINDREVKVFRAPKNTVDGPNNSNGSQFSAITNWTNSENRVNPLNNQGSIVGYGVTTNIQPYETLGEFGNGAHSLIQVNDSRIVLEPWNGGGDGRTGQMLNVTRDANGMRLSITHHLRAVWIIGGATYSRSVMVNTTLYLQISTAPVPAVKSVTAIRYLDNGILIPNTITLGAGPNDLITVLRPEHVSPMPGIGAVSLRGWIQLLGDGTVAYGRIPSQNTGDQQMTISRREPMVFAGRFFKAASSLNYFINPYVQITEVPVNLYIDPPTTYKPRSITRFVTNEWVMAIPNRNTQGPNSINDAKNLARILGNSNARTYDTPEFGTIDGYAINNQRYDLGDPVQGATVTQLSGSAVSYTSLSFWSSTADQTRHQTLSVGQDAADVWQIFKDDPLTMGLDLNAWITDSLINGGNHIGADEAKWNLLISPNLIQRGILIAGIRIGTSVIVYQYCVSIQYGGTAITGLNGFTFGDDTYVEFGSFYHNDPVSTSALSIHNPERAQHIGSLTIFDSGGFTWWAVRPPMISNNSSGAGLDTNYRIFKQVSSAHFSGFNLELQSTINVGVAPVYITAHPDIGVGIMDSNAGYGALTVFRHLNENGYTGVRYMVVTPRPAEGFYVNVTERIPVILSGVIRYIETGQYDIVEQISDPSNTLIYVYATLSQGSVFMEFLETPTIETPFRTLIGQLVTDLTGITAGTLSPVSRFQLYRPSLSERGSSFPVSNGRPDETTVPPLWN